MERRSAQGLRGKRHRPGSPSVGPRWPREKARVRRLPSSSIPGRSWRWRVGGKVSGSVASHLLQVEKMFDLQGTFKACLLIRSDGLSLRASQLFIRYIFMGHLDARFCSGQWGPVSRTAQVCIGMLNRLWRGGPVNVPGLPTSQKRFSLTPENHYTFRIGFPDNIQDA